MSPPAFHPGERCILVLFGASGDLTKSLLMPALYNLQCDGLLPSQFAVVGIAMDEMTDGSFRERMSRDIRAFNTRVEFDQAAWDNLCSRLYYTPGKFGDETAYQRLHELVARLDAQHNTGGNVLFYLATPPSVFGLIASNLIRAGFQKLPGWKRLIVEKPFGADLRSAQELNGQLLSGWQESQIYRVDHYLGKETVQNILAFRFANGMFEPLWNKQHIDHIQFTVSEAVSVEWRGGYYDRAGVLRDMIQNHMFQMLAYVCMEPPSSFAADDIRNEKAKLLRAIRVYKPQQALHNGVRGQYGRGRRAESHGRAESHVAARSDDHGTTDGDDCPAYGEEPGVNPQSNTETFAALRLFIDNWRGRRAGLPALGQGAVDARHQRRRAVQEAHFDPFSGHGRCKTGGESAHLPHPAGPGDRDTLPGQDSRPRDAAPTGQHALQLRRGVPGKPRDRLRGHAL